MATGIDHMDGEQVCLVLASFLYMGKPSHKAPRDRLRFERERVRGVVLPPFNAVARAAAAAKVLSLVDNARLFALLNMTMADALIAGFEAK